jgi:hypothetical protein
MTTPLANFPDRIPFVNLTDGTLSPSASRWLQRQLIPRVGGTDGLSNEELADLVRALSADVESLTATVAALGTHVTVIDGEIAVLQQQVDVLTVGEVLQVATAQPLAEMIFQ